MDLLQSSESMIGQTISKYRVIEQIGQGGMGVVYKAEDLKLRRQVAIKLIAPELTRDPLARSRFLQEAQTISSFEHPNICVVHEIDETADGRMFMAMTYYAGETLKQKIARGPLPLDRALDIAAQVAEGLAPSRRDAEFQECTQDRLRPQGRQAVDLHPLPPATSG